MKPDFALSLSFEGIALLHRAAGGWRSVGEVALDVPDLTAALADLRTRAQRLAPGGLACKLIIPNDQIRYLSLETGRFEGEARRAMVEQALDGATPYAVSDLAFDISVEGTTTHVAAVARETLQEAESFAVEHGFNPVSFVAVPGDTPFLGEPFFGPATRVGDTKIEADGIAVVVIGPAEIPAETAAEVAAETPEETPAEASQDDSEDTATEPPTHAADTTPPIPTAAREPDPQPEPELDDQRAPDPVPVAGFSSRRGKSRSEARGRAPALDGARRNDLPPSPTARKAPAADPAPEPPLDPVVAPDPAPIAAGVTAPVLDVPPAPATPTPPEPEPRGGFLSRRKRTQPAAEPIDGPAATPITAPEAAPAFQSAGAPVSGPADETERMTVFGARDSQKVGGKPRYLGLILTVVLLLFLAAVAAWASLFLDDGIAGLFRGNTDDTEIVTAPAEPEAPDAPPPPADVPPLTSTPAPISPAPTPLDTAPQTLAARPADTEADPQTGASRDAPQAPALTDTDRAVLDALRTPPTVVPPPPATAPADTTTASLSPELDTELDPELEPEPDSAEDEAADPALDTDSDTDSGLNAEARYAATGIWPTAPDTPDTPPVIGLSDLFVASIDRTDLSQDAVALPTPAGFETDVPPASVSSPAAAGTAFQLDNRGLVEPTPEGTVTPDGVTVYLGRPDVVPPRTPTRFEAEPETDALRDRLAGFRPKPRPDGLVEQNERAQLGGRSRAELSQKRPKLRPRSLKEEAEEDDTPTAQAIVVSRVPKPRPRNLDTRSASTRPDTPSGRSGAAVATVAPATVKPKIPSSASVARQATIDNAINLQRVNLIGVYGSPANRRALVRLPSGRYKKVKVGDTVDGGRVVAIGDSELRYQKSGRNMTLKIPSG